MENLRSLRIFNAAKKKLPRPNIHGANGEKNGGGLREIMKIKEFINNGALEAVEADAETTISLLCKSVGFSLVLEESRQHLFANGSEWIFDDATEIQDDMNFIHEAELATIEKVGAGFYGAKLFEVVLPERSMWSISYEEIEMVATASTHQRLAAMLLALSEVE